MSDSEKPPDTNANGQAWDLTGREAMRLTSVNITLSLALHKCFLELGDRLAPCLEVLEKKIKGGRVL